MLSKVGNGMLIVENIIAAFMESLGRLKYSPKTNFIRKYTNLLYYNPKTIILWIDTIKVLEVGGCKFYSNEVLEGLIQIDEGPWLAGTRPADVVLDLGANVGIMCIPLAKKVKKVYAVEPLYTEELKQNLKLNELDNVEVWDFALGAGKDIKLRYRERISVVPTVSLVEIRNRTGPIDFLKANCEGGEWYTKPWELDGIREIRLDYHIGRTHIKERCAKALAFVDWLESHDYSVDVKYLSLGLHSQHKGFYRIMASKKERE